MLLASNVTGCSRIVLDKCKMGFGEAGAAILRSVPGLSRGKPQSVRSPAG